MSALLEDDWYREAYELRERIETLKSIMGTTDMFLFLDNDKSWKNATQKNIRKKIYRPSEYFKDNIWLFVSNQKKPIYTKSDMICISLEDTRELEKYLSSGILIGKNKLIDLPNLWRE